jgi:four helix bundle suffix protein
MKPTDEDNAPDSLIPMHGGYRRLRSFQAAEQIYDATVIFCNRFIDRRSRTHDQMVQAARSGRQNIAEGSMASATSKKSEMKLTNVAKASLEELLLDYEDFLRQRELSIWNKAAPEAQAARRNLQNGNWHAEAVKTMTAHVSANTMACLINQAIYLLKRQIQRLEQDFLLAGGFTERMYRVRYERRELADNEAPACPLCGSVMRRRTARRGRNAGKDFWGCSQYPDCTGTMPI